MTSQAEHAASADPLLRGTFKSVSLGDVFAVLALSRRLLALRLSDPTRAVGTLVIKSGHVLGAEDFRSQARGSDALKALVNSPGTAFQVDELSQERSDPPFSIGLLADFLPAPSGGHGVSRMNPGGDQGLREHRETTSSEDDFSIVPPRASAGASLAKSLHGTDALMDEPRPVSSPGSGGVSEHASSPGERPPSDESVIMVGEFDNISFEEIMQVLQLNDQAVRISFIRDDEEIGSVDLVSEQVLEAHARTQSGIGAFRQLYHEPGERFEVRHVRQQGSETAIGYVSDLLAGMWPDASRSSQTPIEDFGAGELLMRGSLSEFPLVTLASALMLCRQPVELMLCRETQVLHRLLLQAGRITLVDSTLGEGVDDGLAAIRRDPGNQFMILRAERTTLGAPVASLEALLLENDAALQLASIGGVESPASSPALRTGPANATDDSGIDEQLQRLSANLGAIQAALQASVGDRAQSELAQAVSRLMTVQRATLRAFELRVLKELRDHRAREHPRRREVLLLRCLMMLQLVTIALVSVMLVIA